MGMTKTKQVSPEALDSAVSKTNSLIRRTVPINNLVPNELNPNEMEEAEFNMLYDNIERMGVTEAILVRPLGDPDDPECQYKITGGHHRWEVAKLHGFEEVPITIVTDPSFDAEAEKFQMVRYNIIHGKMSPKKFMKLYESLSEQYSQDVAAEMFGFTSEDEFRKLVQSTAQALPPEMKDSFLAASKEIRTINDLALVLNKLFTTYGDTVPYGYMIFDYGGQDHVWLRMKKHQKKDLLTLGLVCQEKEITLDSMMTVAMQLIAKGEFTQELFDTEVDKLPKVDTPALADGEMNEIPPQDYAGIL